MTALAVGTRVMTRRGWAWAGDLEPGAEVLCLHGDGQLRLTRVDETHEPKEADVIRVLTEVGDVVVPANEPLLTQGGPVLARDLPAMAGLGTVRAEVVQPRAIVQATLFADQPKRAAVRAALCWLGRQSISVPQDASSENTKLISEILTTSGVKHTRTADDRWVAWSWSDKLEVDRDARPSAQAMLAITSWIGGQSRTIMQDRAARGALLMAMVLDELQPKVGWTPGYAPVECRITSSALPLSYAKIALASPTREEVVKLILARTGAVVSSQLALGRLG